MLHMNLSQSFFILGLVPQHLKTRLLTLLPTLTHLVFKNISDRTLSSTEHCQTQFKVRAPNQAWHSLERTHDPHPGGSLSPTRHFHPTAPRPGPGLPSSPTGMSHGMEPNTFLESIQVISVPFFSTTTDCHCHRRRSNWSDSMCSLSNPVLYSLVLWEEPSRGSLALVRRWKL